MTNSNPEIGSDIPPRAAEVEPPARPFVPAGGSADTAPCCQTCNNTGHFWLNTMKGPADRACTCQLGRARPSRTAPDEVA